MNSQNRSERIVFYILPIPIRYRLDLDSGMNRSIKILIPNPKCNVQWSVKSISIGKIGRNHKAQSRLKDPFQSIGIESWDRFDEIFRRYRPRFLKLETIRFLCRNNREKTVGIIGFSGSVAIHWFLSCFRCCHRRSRCRCHAVCSPSQFAHWILPSLHSRVSWSWAHLRHLGFWCIRWLCGHILDN